MERCGRALDLTGQRYGRLVALRRTDDKGGRTTWVCRCDCGREVAVRSYHLRNGHVTSCGCAKADSPTYIDGTCVELLRAKTIRRNNTSGVTGVEWCAAKKSWRAAICFKGKRYYLGSYREFEDAVQARKEAEERLHDRFLSEVSKPVSPRSVPDR